MNEQDKLRAFITDRQDISLIDIISESELLHWYKGKSISYSTILQSYYLIGYDSFPSFARINILDIEIPSTCNTLYIPLGKKDEYVYYSYHSINDLDLKRASFIEDLYSNFKFYTRSL
jgi:hypothetical protein